MGIQQTLNIKIDESPNVLNELGNYTYQWRMFLVNELAFRKNEYTLSITPQITIAETGATSLYIDSITMDNYVATNSETLSATRSTFIMELIEPKGANFFDLLLTASQELGISNWSKTPFYLQLSFRGYDDNGDPKFIEGNPNWIWRMQFTSMENTIDEGGSRYTIQGFLSNDMGLTERYGTVPKALSLTGNTFLEMMSNLEKDWNEYEVENANWSSSPLVQYKFIFYEDVATPSPIKLNWQDLKMIESFDSQNPSRSRTADSKQTGRGSGANEQRADFANGWRVQSIIDTLISASSFSEELRKKYPKLSDATTDNKDILSNLGLAKTYLMDPQVIYTAFDPIANDYERLIVYHIWPYDGLTPVLDPTPAAEAGADPNSEINQKKKDRSKAHVLFSEKARNVRRVYNYYYTGKNIDILKFDLRFNNFWTAFISQYEKGQRAIKGPSADKSDSKEITNALEAGRRQEIINKARRTQQEEINRLNEQTLTDEQKAKQIEEIKTRFVTDFQPTIDALNNYREQSNTTKQAALATIRPAAHYAEDLEQNNNISFPSIVPISVDESETTSTTTQGQGIEEHFFEGRNFYGSLLNQMYSTRLPEWMRIEVEIRGDPHWIGHNNLSKFKALYKNVKAVGNLTEKSGRVFVNPINDPSSMVTSISNIDPIFRAHLEGKIREEPNNFPRYELGQQGFLINFYTPDIFRSVDDVTNRVNDQGFTIHKKSAFISGLYMVFSVENRFQDGLFTQLIRAIRDPHTSNCTLNELDAARQEIQSERKSITPTNTQSIQRGSLPTEKLEKCNDNRACRNNNPGNMVGQYYNAVGSDGNFAIYATPADGTKAMSAQLDRYVSGKTTGTPLETTSDIISTWAPAGHGGNNPTLYANTVASKLGISPTENIAKRFKTDAAFKAKFMSAMTDVEAGSGHGYTPEFIEKVIKG